MAIETPVIVTPEVLRPDSTMAPTRPRSRRALLAAALGGLGGMVASRLAVPGPAAAAAGDPFILGSATNNAGTSNTSLATASAGTALLVTQNGTGTALRGSAVGSGSIGGFFTAANGTGVSGVTGNPAAYGVFASNDDGAYGGGGAVRASGKSNNGLVATTENGGANAVRASNTGAGGALGSAILADAGGNCTGVTGRGQSAPGMFGFAVNAPGVYGSSTNEIGVQGAGNPGVYGSSTSTFGAGIEGVGYGSSGHGVVGSALADSGNASGIYGGSAFASAYAGYFAGNVHVTGTLTGSTAAGFRIDHPLEPADKLLLHAAVTSDEALTIYAGTVTTDGQGEATVELPAWFEALNTDLRYQLTVIGSFAQAMVKREVMGNRFTIATSDPATKVCWQLTGVRHDAYARAHPSVVESVKSAAEKNTYLKPVEHGQPESTGVDYPMRQLLRQPRRAVTPPNSD